MSIQEKEVAYLKTTGEPVFVLKVYTANHSASGILSYGSDYAKVRRPWGGSQNGLTHTEETFLVEELESREDHLKRLSDRKKEEMEIDRSLFSAIMGPGAEEPEEDSAGALSVN